MGMDAATALARLSVDGGVTELQPPMLTVFDVKKKKGDCSTVDSFLLLGER